MGVKDESASGAERDAKTRRLPAARPRAAPATRSVLAPEDYRDLVENLNEVIFALDPAGRITYVNAALESVSGFTPAEVIGRNFSEFIVPADLAALAESFRRALEGTVEPWEYRVFHKQGGVRWVRTFSRPVLANGEIVGVRGVISDVTERRLAEDAVRESEARYRDLFENASDIIYIHDFDGRILSMNNAGLRVTGYTAEEVSRLDFTHLVAPEDWPAAQAKMEQILGGEPNSLCEMHIVTKAGLRVSVEVNARAIVREGRRVAVVGIARDLSERRRVETLSAQREQLVSEVRVASALARLGRDLISSRRPATLLDRLCGATAEALPSDWSCALAQWDPGVFAPVSAHGPDAAEMARLRELQLPRAQLSALLAALEAEDVLRVGGPNLGRLLPGLLPAEMVDALVGPLRRRGEVGGLLVAARRAGRGPFRHEEEDTMRGVAQVASLALENAELVTELEHANRMKSDFVATMSHELRTPLNVIIGYAHMLQDFRVDEAHEEVRGVPERIERNAHELLELIDATLAVGRIESGRVPVNTAEIDIAQLIGEIDAETVERRQRQGVTFSWDVVPTSARLHSDALKLKMILRNLIRNALKFTERGSVTVRIAPCAEGLEFAVADTGIGIPPEACKVIFERFRQADGSISARYGGAGLGLYIVKHLVEMLRGTVQVESEVGRGSTFRVWIPFGGPAALVGAQGDGI